MSCIFWFIDSLSFIYNVHLRLYDISLELFITIALSNGVIDKLGPYLQFSMLSECDMMEFSPHFHLLWRD